MISGCGSPPAFHPQSAAASRMARACIANRPGITMPRRTPRSPSIGFCSCSRLDRLEELVLCRPVVVALVLERDLHRQVGVVGEELVQRRVDQPDRDRQPVHRLEDASRVVPLHRQQSRPAPSPAPRATRPGSGLSTSSLAVAEEHVLGAAQPDALGPEPPGPRRVTGGVRFDGCPCATAVRCPPGEVQWSLQTMCSHPPRRRRVILPVGARPPIQGISGSNFRRSPRNARGCTHGQPLARRGDRQRPDALSPQRNGPCPTSAAVGADVQASAARVLFAIEPSEPRSESAGCISSACRTQSPGTMRGSRTHSFARSTDRNRVPRLVAATRISGCDRLTAHELRRSTVWAERAPRRLFCGEHTIARERGRKGRPNARGSK